MKTLADRFLSEPGKEKIRAAVKDVEKQTSGELVPMVVSSSYDYPMADVTGATAFSLPISILATPLIGGRFWLGSQNMWVFIGLFAIWFVLFYFIIRRISTLKRLFISKDEIEEEVEEAATLAFFREGLYRTRDETGVMIFISVFEKKVRILADRGINETVGPDQWKDIVNHITAGIHAGRQADAICEAVRMSGDLLKERFPIRRGDADELDNLIIGE